MEIATFTSGKTTLIGIKNKRNSISKKIDSKMLYQDPQKFRNRFLSLIKNFSEGRGLQKGDKLIFALSGIMDEDNAIILESEEINNVSFEKYFDNFSLRQTFDPDVGSENIYLIDTAKCISYSHDYRDKKKLVLPALSIYIDTSISLYLVKESGFFNYDHVLNKADNVDNNLSVSRFNDYGINQLLIENEDDLDIKYSKNLLEFLQTIIIRLSQDGSSIKQVYIYMTKTELLEERILKDGLPYIKLNFIGGEESDKDLPLTGAFNCLKFYETLKLNDLDSGFKKKLKNIVSLGIANLGLAAFVIPPFNLLAIPAAIALLGYIGLRISKVTYYKKDGTQMITINNFEEFTEHWRSTKPIAANDNYYIIKYSDNSTIKIELNSLESYANLLKLNKFEENK